MSELEGRVARRSRTTCTPFTATAAPSAAMAARAVSSGVDAWRAAMDGTMRYWQGAWERGVTPLDVLTDLSRWFDETASRREPRPAYDAFGMTPERRS